MKIYDISQEVFSCQVYPDDPAPEKKIIRSMEKGEVYNLTAFSMCAHNGTHIDAPRHFIRDGKTVDEKSLEAFIGMAYVAEHSGVVTYNDATEIIEKAKKHNAEAAKRILIKGDVEISLERQRYLPLQISYFSETSLSRSDRKTRQGRYILHYCLLMLSCLRGFVWQRCPRVSIS